MSGLEKLLTDMRAEMHEKFANIENSIAKSEEKITANIIKIMDEKYNSLRGEVNSLHTITEEQEKRINEIEKKSVQKNLVFFGIKEGEKSYLELEEKVCKIMKEKMKLDISASQIESIRRIGIKGNKTRPVSVTFTTLGTKIKILKNKQMLEGSGVYIKHEYPAKILKIREELKSQQKIEKEKGNEAFIRYDKLIITNSKKKTSNKRAPSSSPQQLRDDSTETREPVKTTKKHKEQAARKNSSTL
ncbi:uncharacterized protein LOC125225763 [Leguminivora glycinivorella]|uniref:uncharacterized protein LOC125225763 n=1 Tax=Leguminivora glycinivorella TaxID=1035111 RepID=UPI0020109B74|nr:uncharacterized protein LOC125225763 [Leguminivora glycinivorella]